MYRRIRLVINNFLYHPTVRSIGGERAALTDKAAIIVSEKLAGI
jgi:hypothetical protein